MTAPYTGGFPSLPSGLPGGNQSPFSSTPGSTFGGSQMSSAQQSAIEQAIHNSPDLAGIWDTIKNSGGDVWGTIQGLIDKAGGWGKIGSDVFGFIKNNASGILQGLNALNSYQRQGKADQYAQQALKLAQSSYDAKAPLRAAGQAGMLDPHASTPNLSNLSAQGQHGSSIQAPLPLAAPQTAYQNAGSVAGNNPFTKGLPMAPAPVSSAPPIGPGGPNVPGQPPGGFKPYQPLPLGPGGGTGPLPPTVSLPPQSGPIKAGPKDRPLPMGTMPVPPNQPLPKTVPHYTNFAPGS